MTRGIAVECVICGLRKKPVGRSAPPGMALCDHECEGYFLPPNPGSLWPEETDEIDPTQTILGNFVGYADEYKKKP